MAASNITTAAGRARLKPRREPYFAKVTKGQHLGFRRLESGGTWVARHQIGTAKEYRSLGSDADFPEYKDALQKALEWFADRKDEDRPDDALTVTGAIKEYVRDLKTRKSPEAARRAEQAAGKHILPTLGKLEVSRLTTKRLKTWKDGLPKSETDAETIRRSKDTANRVLNILKAALNLAFRDGSVRSDTAWRRLKPFDKVSRARDVFLSQVQCAALLEACEPDFKQLVRSALLTGARYGELTARKVADFDPKQGVLRVVDGKTGSRDIILNDTGIAHFKALAKDKLPAALLHYREVTRKDVETGELRTEIIPWGKSEQHRRIKAAVAKANKSLKTAADRLPPDTCFYSLRHTHASLALLAGVNIQVLAENMGTSVRMIEKHYGKFLRADRRAMFNQLVVA